MFVRQGTHFGIHRLEVLVSSGSGPEAGERLCLGVEVVGSHGLGVHGHAQLLEDVS